MKTLYRVRGFVLAKPKKNNPYPRHEFDVDEIIVDNLETAKSVFDANKGNLRTWEPTAIGGKVQLFIPHIHDSGALAYWPDNNDYIDQWAFGVCTLD